MEYWSTTGWLNMTVKEYFNLTTADKENCCDRKKKKHTCNFSWHQLFLHKLNALKQKRLLSVCWLVNRVAQCSFFGFINNQKKKELKVSGVFMLHLIQANKILWWKHLSCFPFQWQLDKTLKCGEVSAVLTQTQIYFRTLYVILYFFIFCCCCGLFSVHIQFYNSRIT